MGLKPSCTLSKGPLLYRTVVVQMRGRQVGQEHYAFLAEKSCLTEAKVSPFISLLFSPLGARLVSSDNAQCQFHLIWWALQPRLRMSSRRIRRRITLCRRRSPWPAFLRLWPQIQLGERLNLYHARKRFPPPDRFYQAHKHINEGSIG